MKLIKHVLIVALIALATSTFAQSDSFKALRENFADEEDVHSFKVSGFMCRAVLWMAGEWEFREAISEVRSIRLITIPMQNFAHKKLSVPGFRKYLESDHFESLVTVKEEGERVEVYLQQSGNQNDRYLVLVQEGDEMTVIEINGHIDIQKMKEIGKENENTLSFVPISGKENRSVTF